MLTFFTCADRISCPEKCAAYTLYPSFCAVLFVANSNQRPETLIRGENKEINVGVLTSDLFVMIRYMNWAMFNVDEKDVPNYGSKKKLISTKFFFGLHNKSGKISLIN